MGQREFLRELDESILDDIADAGLSDVGTYTPSTGGTPIEDCRLLVDRAVTLTGAQGQVINDAIVITCFAADVGNAPAPGARYRIGDEVFTVDSLNNKDESRYVCVVKPGN